MKKATMDGKRKMVRAMRAMDAAVAFLEWTAYALCAAVWAFGAWVLAEVYL